MTNRRWDIDTRGIGIADAETFAAPIRELLQATSESGWVTEDADAHLGIHLRRACAEPGSPWKWITASQDSDGVFEIELSHSSHRVMDIWREAVALLSTIAEQSFHVAEWTIRPSRRSPACCPATVSSLPTATRCGCVSA